MLKVYNTLTRCEEEFKTLNEKEVKMYVCGPTVYDNTHLGHGRTYVSFDIIRRYLEHMGYTVNLVINFTDIDDKIIKRAYEKEKDPKEISEQFIKVFLDDMATLKVKPADIYPKVTEHISEIIAFIEKLIEKGFAYKTEDGVYFEVKKFKNYGKLSNINLEDLVSGARIETSEKKKNQKDFALWKTAKPGEPKWESPFGSGRPGWHIECSAMSSKYLGEQFDIHGGGRDLSFPHHENEIAQSSAYSGKDWVNYWLHTGFVMVNGEKMSKSLGNFVTIGDISKEYSPEILRFFFIQRHYRSPIDYTAESMNHVKNNLEKIYNVIENIRISLEKSEKSRTWDENEFLLYDILKNSKNNFYNAMNSDFNTVKALKSVFEVSNGVNKYLSLTKTPSEGLLLKALDFYKIIGEIFGLFENYFKESSDSDEEEFVTFLIELRSDVRLQKNYEMSDKIRDGLKNLGYQIEDNPKEGTVFKKINI
ncbi:cysteine--tRNA ligase [Methanococcus maripaludis]|uniref:Cysteine--tRNA ligase n=1 Tax=Methanococcus maripaludis (strain DSM 14266 / JCM 13030 / NBRC 101832 / S2 / LL) TaxID=267377 RepID=SYC_METMP|nr:cysteine--tRNA ligase [Methanococcus maripaludis]Q6LYD1.1 RecName: Full=Cysteine--tRNA ligase; AltName: Full=Cysteinyl-tRNA synthetase; Short=CysRS [Methanococcus maripaludis S2]CAF30616.1 Cysteinyl-tRNA synthetase [Methanococcus maripaludis S2]